MLVAVYAGDLGHSGLALGHSADLGHSAISHGAISHEGVSHGAIAHDGLGGAGLAGAGIAGAGLAGAGIAGPAQVVGVSQVRGAPRVTQSLSRGPTHTSVSQGPTHVSRQKVGFTPGTTTIRRDYETDTVHQQHRVDTIRTDKVIPKVTTVQHNAVRPVDVTHAQTHTEVHNSVKHIPHVSHSSRQHVSQSQDSIVHPQAHHASGNLGLGLAGSSHGLAGNAHGLAGGSHGIAVGHH